MSSPSIAPPVIDINQHLGAIATLRYYGLISSDDHDAAIAAVIETTWGKRDPDLLDLMDKANWEETSASWNK
jgi:hypothetical protein